MKKKYGGIESAYLQMGVNISADAETKKLVKKLNEQERERNARKQAEHEKLLRDIDEATEKSKRHPAKKAKARSFAEMAADCYGGATNGGSDLIGTTPRGGVR